MGSKKIFVEDVYVASRAARLTGFRSTYMLDYLCRNQIVVPSVEATPGKGRRRKYAFRDLVLLRSVNHLLSRGLPVRKLKIAIDTLRDKFSEVSRDVVLPANRFLMTDGTSVLLHDGMKNIFDLTNGGQMAFAFMLDVEKIRSEVVEALKKSA